MLGAFAPGGAFMAAWATGNADRFEAGADLIRAGSPERAAALSAASRLVNANAEALQACAEAAKKAGKEQKCSVVVQAPAQ
jgi:Pyruvate/2-oxoacid:ferredoxin oxidoreductase gamma subunit